MYSHLNPETLPIPRPYPHNMQVFIKITMDNQSDTNLGTTKQYLNPINILIKCFENTNTSQTNLPTNTYTKNPYKTNEPQKNYPIFKQNPNHQFPNHTHIYIYQHCSINQSINPNNYDSSNQTKIKRDDMYKN